MYISAHGRVAPFALAGLSILLLSCGGSGGGGSMTGPDGGGSNANTVEVLATDNFRFQPATVTIPPGTTVRWRSTSSVEHSVTPDQGTEWQGTDLDSSGDTFEHTFMTPGTYPYHCVYHLAQGMTGTVVVQAGASSSGQDGGTGGMGNDGGGGGYNPGYGTSATR